MVSNSSPPGVIDDHCRNNNLILRAQDSEFLSLCENKPEIVFRLRCHTPLKQYHFVNSFFLDFLRENTDLNLYEEYYHADQSVEAFQKALAKYMNQPLVKTKPIPQNLLDIADEWVYDEVSRFTLGSQPITISQILEKVQMQSSPGPLARAYASTKHLSILEPEGADILNDYILQMSETGCRTYWGANLKQELRPVEKVGAKKTRLFMSAPTEHFLLLSCLTQQFNESIITAARHGLTPICIGMPLYYGMVDKIGKDLEKYHRVFCLDINGWDTSIKPEEHAANANLRWRCFDPKFKTTRLYNQLVNSYRDVVWTPLVLPDGTVIMVPGQPSGQYCTGIDNSLTHLRRLYLTWLVNGGPPSFDLFKKHVYVKVAGDDSIIGVTEYGYKFINEQSLVNTNKDYFGCGCEFSNQLEFLGHYFLHDNTSYFPGFSMSRVIASLAYKGGRSPSTALEAACGSRIEAFTNPDCLRIVDRYIAYLIKCYPSLMSQYKLQFPDDQKISTLIGSGTSLILQSRTKTLLGMSTIKIENVKNTRRRNTRKPKARSTTIIEVPKTQSQNANASRGRGKRKRTQKRISNKSTGSTLSGELYYPGGTPATDAAGNHQGSLADLQCDYGKMLIDPSNFCVRQPDGSGKLTAVISSTMYLTIAVDPTISGGQFSFRVRPTLGSPSSPSQYKVALTNPNVNWAAADWENPLSYASTATYAGQNQDIRVDPIMSALTNPPLGQLTLIKADAVTTPYPFSTVVAPFVAGGVNWVYEIPYRYSITNPATSTFHIPPGQYMIIAHFVSVGTPDVTPSVNGASEFSHVTSITNGSDLDMFFQANIFGPDPYLSFTGDGIHFSGAYIFIIPTYNPQIKEDVDGVPFRSNNNNGQVTEIRPVAMSVLATCLVAPINAGGVFNIARVSGGSDLKSYTRNNGSLQTGQLQYADALGRCPRSSSNKIVNGGYAWWAPEDNSDREFKFPDAALLSDYPTIIGSGVWQPNTVVAGQQAIMRLQIVTNYEFTTVSPLFQLKIAQCLDVHREEVEMLLRQYPWAMANEEHVSFIQRAKQWLSKTAQKTANFYSENSALVNKLALGFGSMLLV